MSLEKKSLVSNRIKPVKKGTTKINTDSQVAKVAAPKIARPNLTSPVHH